ncbi:unnamed protein product [Symbiodinium pilosum]|uniref:Uncharacterized protein n=1 Tax=Symbiodinium pilosum TaxID=2952 RepID=A0A812R1X5_SYMPI|nr:unnamed protein product [Symbiodinium pilosum]
MALTRSPATSLADSGTTRRARSSAGTRPARRAAIALGLRATTPWLGTSSLASSSLASPQTRLQRISARPMSSTVASCIPTPRGQSSRTAKWTPGIGSRFWSTRIQTLRLSS